MKRTITKFLSRFKKGMKHWTIALTFTLTLPPFLKFSAKIQKEAEKKKPPE